MVIITMATKRPTLVEAWRMPVRTSNMRALTGRAPGNPSRPNQRMGRSKTVGQAMTNPSTSITRVTDPRPAYTVDMAQAGRGRVEPSRSNSPSKSGSSTAFSTTCTPRIRLAGSPSLRPMMKARTSSCSRMGSTMSTRMLTSSAEKVERKRIRRIPAIRMMILVQCTALTARESRPPRQKSG